MKNKNVLITGANTGIGYATAEALAKKGATVIMVCRNEEKGKRAQQQIIEKTGNPQVDLHLTDLSSQQQIRTLAKSIREQYDALHLLINNAAAFFTEFGKTEDGIERQWAVNHLAYFLLTGLLIDRLMASAPARIVVVSSTGNYKGNIHFDDLNLENGYDGLKAYRQSKLANVLFTYELARKMEGKGVTVNTLHPGVVGTQIGYANNQTFISWIWRLANPFMLSSEKGAETSIYLASSPEVEGVTGKYFEQCKPKRSAELSYDEALAAKLWKVSEKQVGLSW